MITLRVFLGTVRHHSKQLIDSLVTVSLQAGLAKEVELIKANGKDDEGKAKTNTELKAFEKTLMCMPGDNRELSFTLAYPMPVEKGLKFAIREGKITVGAGVVNECVGLDTKVSIEGIKKVAKMSGKAKPAKK